MLLCPTNWLWTMFWETLRIMSQTVNQSEALRYQLACLDTDTLTTFVLQRFLMYPQWRREISKSNGTVEKFHVV